MVNNANGHNLYWTGGPFQIVMNPPNAKALAIIEKFRDACQKQYIAFNGGINGRKLAFDRFEKLMTSRNHRIFVGSGPPDYLENRQQQKPGYSCIAEMTQGELLDGLSKDGTFEAEHAKAFVIMIYSLWEENYRSKVADIMEVKKNNVMCKLMNDARRIRNCIIHDKGIVSENLQDKLVLLSQIWSITPGELKITESMLHSLMEQINALRVEIKPRKS